MPRQKQKNNKIVIGVTGSFGSGKSSVAGIFASGGAKIIDADKIARGCLKRPGRGYKKVISIFGPRVIGENKEIDRHILGKIVFSDIKQLNKLDRIVHPEVIRLVKKEIGSIKKGVVILDAPLLLEAGLRSLVDKLVVVTAGENTQIKRLLKRTSLSRADILRRIKFQIPFRVKARLADFIIDNSGTLEKTRKQVKGIMMQLISCPASCVRGLRINSLPKKRAN
jgi:dephospho-CoA kinase